MTSLYRPTSIAVGHHRCTATAAQYEIPPSDAHLFLTMGPQSPIDPPLASISMFSSLVCQGKRLLCVYVCEYAYLHHHYYRSPHTSKCHYIFIANVFLGVTRPCMCVYMCLHALFFFYCMHVGPDVGQSLCFPSGA